MEGEFHGIVPIGIDVAKKLLAVHGVVMLRRAFAVDRDGMPQ